MDDNLDGIKARPDLFPQKSKKVPDVNYFFRYFCHIRSFFVLFLSKKTKSELYNVYFCMYIFSKIF